jgi:hypothetical protein
MPRRRHICDVPGCGAPRERWQRICERCYRALPGAIRTGLIDAWRLGRKPAWRTFRKQAGEHMRALELSRQSAPREAYERQQRLLGERP